MCINNLSIIIVILINAGLPFDHHTIITTLRTVTDWFMLGHSLKIEHTALKRIETQYGSDIERCKVEMVDHWLKTDVTASWEKLLQALRDRNYNDVIRSFRDRTISTGEYIYTYVDIHFPPQPVADDSQSG